jgi:hypothetical protein
MAFSDFNLKREQDRFGLTAEVLDYAQISNVPVCFIPGRVKYNLTGEVPLF